jgi:MFS family permease
VTVQAVAPAGYKWIALSNTTLGMLIATINSSIVLIALPDIFKGIAINPLDPANTGYLLWMIMGFLVVTAVLVVSFGRLGDMYGRARMYNLASRSSRSRRSCWRSPGSTATPPRCG